MTCLELLERPISSTAGIGTEAKTLVSLQAKAQGEFIRSSSMTAFLESEFNDLAEKWKENVHFNSMFKDIISDPSYQKIISIGWYVLPFILRELESQPGHWQFALKAITKTDPVPKEDRGDLLKIRAHWLNWAFNNHLVW